MPARKFTLEAVNKRLKAARIGVGVLQRGNKLYLQATLPPKPDSGRKRPYQQQIPLRINANPDGLEEAETQAYELGTQIARGTFSWIDNGLSGTCADWIERYRKYLQANKLDEEQGDYIWREDYWNPALKWLPPNAPLTEQAIIQAAEHYSVTSRSREICLGILRKFIGWCGLNLDLSLYRSTYSPKSVQPIDVLDDEAISLGGKRLNDNKNWLWVYGMMAAYGLRPHECWRVEGFEWIDEIPIVNISQHSKTGDRIARPLHLRWVNEWKLTEGHPPSLNIRRNKDYGERTAKHFKRCAVGFKPYSLRHSYAIRGSILYGLPVAIMARMMGHSPEVHLKTYNRWLSADTEHQIYLSALKRIKDERI